MHYICLEPLIDLIGEMATQAPWPLLVLPPGITEVGDPGYVTELLHRQSYQVRRKRRPGGYDARNLIRLDRADRLHDREREPPKVLIRRVEQGQDEAFGPGHP